MLNFCMFLTFNKVVIYFSGLFSVGMSFQNISLDLCVCVCVCMRTLFTRCTWAMLKWVKKINNDF